MINEFRVFQEFVEETQEAILDTHKSLSEREAGICTMMDKERDETLQQLRNGFL